MKNLIPVILAVLAIASVAVFFNTEMDDGVVVKVGKPIPKKVAEPLTPEQIAAKNKEANAFKDGTLKKGSGVASETKGSWGEFRGPGRDNILDDGVKLIRNFGDAGPKVQWERKVTQGHAGVVIHNGMVYLHDYDIAEQADVIRCMSLDNAADIWTYSYPAKVKNNHGITRCTPAVNDQYLVTFGPKCHVCCFDPVTGERKWARSLVLDYGSEIPKWAAGQCPLIQGTNVIIAPGGPEALMVALDLETGEEKWRTPNPEGWQMTHCSIGVMTIAGKKMYVYTGSAGVGGVDAETGDLLWVNREWKIKTAAIATPLYVGDGKIFLSSGYGVGSMMIQVKEDDGVFEATSLFRLDKDTFEAGQQTPIFYKNAIFGVRNKPVDQVMCLDLEGGVKWECPSNLNFALGPFMIADDMLILVTDKAHLTLAEASPKKFKVLATAQLLEKAHDTWAPMAMVDGRLILRDREHMLCLDLRASSYE